MERYIRSLGRSLIDIAVFLSNFTVFSNNVIKTFIKLKLFNPAVYIVFMRQIYFTGVQILPVYIVISLIMGVALVGSLSSATNLLGSGDQVGRIFVVITFQQLAPLLTAILLALRSATAVTAEISLMKINREIDTLRSMSIDPYEYLYLPRITAGIICMVALSTIFVCVATSHSTICSRPLWITSR
jgi:phospholipid/cholesterol/gamma-HCH transport system permease protein